MNFDSSNNEPATTATLQRLRKSLRQAEGSVVSTASDNAGAIRTGCLALDKWLPQGGWPRAAVVEWLACGPGTGASTLALSAAATVSADGRAVVLIDRSARFYPPAAVSLGIDLDRLVIVRPQLMADELWTLDQAARCTDVAAVLWWCGRLNDRHFRRLQLACESSETLGLLVRPESMRSQPSWAHMRFFVQPRPAFKLDRSGVPLTRSEARRLRVELLRCRGGQAGTSVELEIDDETGEIREARPLRLAPRRTIRHERPARTA